MKNTSSRKVCVCVLRKGMCVPNVCKNINNK